MIQFNNSILEDLSPEGKSYVGVQLQYLFKELPDEDIPQTTIGLKIKFTNDSLLINSLTEVDLEDTVDIRLNCELYLSVQLRGKLLDEYLVEPYYFTVESFSKLEKLLSGYNAYWKGDSMFVKGGLG